tara:strand:+ start:1012 stop:1269 length:258 start_codon:yes stop_codon:yes gene_type:complete
MSRQERRAIKKQIGSETQEKMASQVEQFGKLPQACDACREEFDKRDKEMVQSWSVVVKQETVRLFCPECINKAKEVLNVSDKNIE